jgi:hypothetical protein
MHLPSFLKELIGSGMINHAENAAQLGYSIGVHLAESGRISIVEPIENFSHTAGPHYSRVMFDNELYYASHSTSYNSPLISEWNGDSRPPNHFLEHYCVFTKESKSPAIESFFDEDMGRYKCWTQKIKLVENPLKTG